MVRNEEHADASRSSVASLEGKSGQPEVLVRRRWSTAFLMAGSALLGATAIAFWNRRTISHMRSQLQAKEPVPPPSSDNEII